MKRDRAALFSCLLLLAGASFMACAGGQTRERSPAGVPGGLPAAGSSKAAAVPTAAPRPAASAAGWLVAASAKVAEPRTDRDRGARIALRYVSCLEEVKQKNHGADRIEGDLDCLKTFEIALIGDLWSGVEAERCAKADASRVTEACASVLDFVKLTSGPVCDTSRATQSAMLGGVCAVLKEAQKQPEQPYQSFLRQPFFYEVFTERDGTKPQWDALRQTLQAAGTRAAAQLTPALDKIGKTISVRMLSDGCQATPPAPSRIEVTNASPLTVSCEASIGYFAPEKWSSLPKQSPGARFTVARPETAATCAHSQLVDLHCAVAAEDLAPKLDPTLRSALALFAFGPDATPSTSQVIFTFLGSPDLAWRPPSVDTREQPPLLQIVQGSVLLTPIFHRPYPTPG